MIVSIDSDDEYALWVNGELTQAGSSSGFVEAQGYSIIELDPYENVFAVDVVNGGGPAAFIAMILLAFSDGTSATFVTDNTWKAFTGIQIGFEEPDFDDSTWPAATVLGPYGIAPWGDIVVPLA